MNSQRDPVVYYDCTATVRSGLKTGIQRVVMAIAAQREIFESKLDIKFIPICFQFDNFYTIDDALQIKSNDTHGYKSIDFQHKDIYLCADAFWTMDMYKWYPFIRQRGVQIATVIYDLIPITHPHFCTKEDTINFEMGMRAAVRFSDRLISISRETKKGLIQYLENENLNNDSDVKNVNNPLEVIPLAPALINSSEIIFNEADLVKLAHKFGEYLLMVGTLEPRRNYEKVLNIMQELWQGGNQLSLVIVGKEGAFSQKIISLLNELKNMGMPVFWEPEIEDDVLITLYQYAKAVVCASAVEGYGMSVAEGLKFNGKVFANKLPVFGEFAGSLPYYFDIDTPDQLKNLVVNHKNLKSMREYSEIQSGWSDTALSLCSILSELSPIFYGSKPVEINSLSAAGVRWASWIKSEKECDKPAVDYWLENFQDIRSFLNAYSFEMVKNDGPITAEAVRWAFLFLYGRESVSEDEIIYFKNNYETIGQLVTILNAKNN